MDRSQLREPPGRGRPREFDEQAVLDAAVQVFWAKGYAAASVSDLVQATGLNRGSLYGAFGDKQLLFEKALKRYAEEIIRPAVASVLTIDPPLDAIRTLLMEPIRKAFERGDRRGCLLCNAAAGLEDPDDPLRDAVTGYLRIVEGAFETLLARIPAFAGDAARRLRHAQGLIVTFYGLMTLGQTALDRAGLEFSVEQAMTALRAAIAGAQA